MILTIISFAAGICWLFYTRNTWQSPSPRKWLCKCAQARSFYGNCLALLLTDWLSTIMSGCFTGHPFNTVTDSQHRMFIKYWHYCLLAIKPDLYFETVFSFFQWLTDSWLLTGHALADCFWQPSKILLWKLQLYKLQTDKK